ncbi:MAG: bifunctional nuclease family protein [bacterium]
MFVEMELREIQIVEDSSRNQVVILKERDGSRQFPIFIGLFEALALDSAVRGFVPPRPMTHDLVFNVIEGAQSKLVRVLVDDLRDETFHGKLVLELPSGQEVLVDSRPSDAIVLASKRRAPIFVAEHVLDQVCREESDEQEGEN